MKFVSARRVAHCGLLLIIAACSAGCGESGPPRIQGTVTLNGSPVKQGEIKFAPLDGTGDAVAGLIADGAYSVTAKPGAKRVEIQAFEQVGEKALDPSMPGSAKVPVLKPLLPEKYNTASELTLEVGGSTEKDFELTSP